MESSPQLPRWGSAFEAKVEQLFDIADEVNTLRSELEGRFANQWHYRIIDNIYGEDEIAALTGRAVTAINSDRQAGGLIHNLVQGVIFIEYPERQIHPASRVLIVHNRFNNDSNGKTHVFQSKAIKIDEFNRLSMKCSRTFRGTTPGFDDYELGDFGAYYDHEENHHGDSIRIYSHHRLFGAPDSDSKLNWTTEKLPSIGRQNKALKVARMILQGYKYAFINPDT